jgi:hypothetical protein
MMQLAVYLDAGHRALGKPERGSCRLNYSIGSTLEWSRFAYDAGLWESPDLLLLFVHANRIKL